MEQSTIPQVIFFDLDDTLIYEVATDSAVIVEVVRRFVPAALSIPPATLLQAVHSSARALWQESPAVEWCRSIGTSSIEGLYGDYSGDDPHLAQIRRYIEQESYRERVWREALLSLDLATANVLIEEIADAFVAERPRRHELLPDAGTVLEQLGQKYRMILLTNGAPAIQRRKLAGSGFAPRFETVIVSGEFGFGKPDPAIFHHALKLAGVAADEIVMIGNSLANDVVGAQNVGIKSIWFNIDKEATPRTIQPWQTVTMLREIPVLVDRPVSA